jgi:hypothetical protein
MSKIAAIVAVAGLAGAALTKFGVLGVMPLRNWVIVAAVGVVGYFITRRAGD